MIGGAVEFSGRRLWKSIVEAMGLARGAGAAANRIISWLVLLGVAPLAAWLVPEHWLSLGGSAIGLWMATIVGAFALSVKAIYAKQTELDKQLDAARTTRREQRRPLMEGMLRILMAAERIRIAQQLTRSSDQHWAGADPLTEAREELAAAVSAYAEAANRAHAAEALLHGMMATQLRAVLDHERSLISLGLPLQRLSKLCQKLAFQDERLFKDEADSVRSGLEIIRDKPLHKSAPPESVT